MKSRSDVIRAIEQAFDGASLPQTDRELAPPSIDAPYAIEHFLGKTRDEVESRPFLGSLYMEDFTYMTEAAVQYYLPCPLKLMMAEPYDDELWIFLHGFLRTRKGALSRSLRGLTPSQRSAISGWADFLRSEWEREDSWSPDPLQAAELARDYRVIS